MPPEAPRLGRDICSEKRTGSVPPPHPVKACRSLPRSKLLPMPHQKVPARRSASFRARIPRMASPASSPSLVQIKTSAAVHINGSSITTTVAAVPPDLPNDQAHLPRGLGGLHV